MSTGDTIGTDIAIVESFVGPYLVDLSPGIGNAVDLGLKLLAKAEPAIYNAAVAVIQGVPLTPEQTQAKNDAITRLQNPASYFE